ncbi:Fatty-acid amide hydrolase 2 [Chamberlinius hualienensis]
MSITGELLYHSFSIIRDILTFCGYLTFKLVNYRQTKVQLSAIRHPILLESATTIAQKIRTKEITSEEVVKAFITRINDVNGSINAMVAYRFDKAIQEAQDVDKFLRETNLDENDIENEKPFLGVPYTIKENFQVKGLRQTVGLVARKDYVCEEDASLVTLMHEAGAILLGKTNLSELCTWWESRNNVYGQTNNPYDTRRIVGGSSGGEGSLIASAGSVMGIGSDIGGSIRMPAFFNGIFGHKPSPGIVTNSGQLPSADGELAECLATGPICRYATDLLPMLKILAGPNANVPNLYKNVDITTVKIFTMTDDGGFPLVTKVSSELKNIQEQAVRYFEGNYKMRVQRVHFPEMARSLEFWAGKMCGGGAPTFCEEMLQRQGKINIYTEILKWVVGKSQFTLPAIGLGLLEKVEVGKQSEDYKELSIACRRLKQDIQRVIGDDGVLLYPSFPVTAPYHYQPLIMPFNFVYAAIFNVIGFPVTQVPLGLGNEGLPLGIQVAANTNNDHLCLAVARELEKGFKGWVCPSKILK